MKVLIYRYVYLNGLQNNGQDQLTPTDEINISPPFLKLKPNESYNLRVVRINPEPISGEKNLSYYY